MTSFVLSLVMSAVFNPMFWVGYGLCVLFPVPFLNSFILSGWSKFGSSIVSGIKSVFSGGSSVVANVETEVANAVVSTVGAAVSNVVVANVAPVVVANVVANTTA